MKSMRKSAFSTMIATMALLLTASGCTAGEAVVDGFYGGISDTIAGVISETLLAVAGF